MSGWLLDTNVVSELKKPRPNAKVVAYIGARPLDRLYLSVVTLAEIRFGIEKLADPARRSDLTTWLDTELRPMFGGRIVAVEEETLLKWRLIIGEGRRRGHTFSHPDVLIAASAALHGLIVATRNVTEFVATGVAVDNPWTGKSTAARV